MDRFGMRQHQPVPAVHGDRSGSRIALEHLEPLARLELERLPRSVQVECRARGLVVPWPASGVGRQQETAPQVRSGRVEEDERTSAGIALDPEGGCVGAARGAIVLDRFARGAGDCRNSGRSLALDGGRPASFAPVSRASSPRLQHARNCNKLGRRSRRRLSRPPPRRARRPSTCPLGLAARGRAGSRRKGLATSQTRWARALEAPR
jgi:hypothetical protein